MLLGIVLLAGASASQAQVSFGIRIGPPPRSPCGSRIAAKSGAGFRLDRRLLVSKRPSLQSGMTAIGRALPMQALVGSSLTTTASNILMVTGTEIAAGWSTITAWDHQNDRDQNRYHGDDHHDDPR